MIAGDSLLIGEREHHLEDWQGVKHADQEQDAQVELGLLVDGFSFARVVQLG